MYSHLTTDSYLLLQVTMANFLVQWDHKFSLNEYVEVHSDVMKDASTVNCSNGTIVRTHRTSQIFDVALEVKTTVPSDSVVTAVPYHALRKRFLCGEIVECYLEQTGWTLAYVVRQLPNAVSIPPVGELKGMTMQCSISLYEVYVSDDEKNLQPQTIRAPSYHIRKFIGHPCERIFPNLGAMLAAKKITTSEPFASSMSDGHSAFNLDTVHGARLSKEDQKKEIAHFLDEFRAHLDEGDMIEVAVLEGVPSGKNFFRRAICTHVPG